MPSRPTLLTSNTSPRQSTNAVNEVVHVWSRKLNTHRNEQTTQHPPTRRRDSFKMESILHPARKEKKRNDSKDRDSLRKEQKRNESNERDSLKKEKRSSLTLRPGSKSKDKMSTVSPHLGPVRPGKFEMIMESPPAIFFGAPATSTGALLSGRLKLTVEDPAGEVTLTDFSMVLQVVTTTRKPVAKECGPCARKCEELKRWTFVTEPTVYAGHHPHELPWSFLVPGHLPATSVSQLGAIGYEFVVHATTVLGDAIDFVHPLKVDRAVIPGPDKASVRIFPPTNLTGRVQLPPVVHPIGAFPVQMTLAGVVERKAESQTRWRLRKMMWRIEENSKVVSAPCDRHAAKVSEGKAIQHTDGKTLGHDEMKAGWKTDFDTAGGAITLEFDAAVATRPGHRVTCDVDSASGLEVKHTLVLELIVSEEFCPNRNTQLITPTGAARVLRMQFALLVTERAGMGISWDEEMPPTYEDVPASPPGYRGAPPPAGAGAGAEVEDYHGPDLEYVELERMPTADPHDPPVYRERDRRPRDRDPDPPAAAGPSAAAPRRRPAGFTLDELETEAPPYALRGRRASTPGAADAEADYGEGVAGDAPARRRGIPRAV